MSELRFFMTRGDTEDFVAWLIDEFKPRFAV
jgi:hypothetical protein